MFSTSTSKLALVLSATVLMLTGCGDADERAANATTTPATSSDGATSSTAPLASATPAAAQAEGDGEKEASGREAAWAERLCSALQGRVSAIQPPQVDTSSPQATLTSLRTFFGDVVKEQQSQLETLKTVGPPPGASAERAYDRAIDELRSVRGDLQGVRRRLKAATVSSAADVQALIAQVGSQVKSLNEYGGPVASLAANGSLGPALRAETGCARFV